MTSGVTNGFLRDQEEDRSKNFRNKRMYRKFFLKLYENVSAEVVKTASRMPAESF